MAIRWSQTAISFRLNCVKLGQSVFEKNKQTSEHQKCNAEPGPELDLGRIYASGVTLSATDWTKCKQMVIYNL